MPVREIAGRHRPSNGVEREPAGYTRILCDVAGVVEPDERVVTNRQVNEHGDGRERDRSRPQERSGWLSHVRDIGCLGRGALVLSSTPYVAHDRSDWGGG